MSKRQDRKNARAAAHKLRKDASWNPEGFKPKDPMEKLRELDAKEKSAEAMAASDGCQACADVRAETGDDTALCDDHLAAAMGF
jgi:hypothetical protein